MSTESQGPFEVGQEVIFKKGRVYIPGRFTVVKVEPAGDDYLGEIPQLVTIQLPDGPDKFSADYLEVVQ